MSSTEPPSHQGERAPVQPSLPAPEMLTFEENEPRPIPAPVELAYASRRLTMHSVTEEELSTLRAVVPTTCVAFWGMAVGIAFSLWIALKSTGLTIDTVREFRAFFAVAVFASLFLTILAVSSYVHLFIVLRRIKQRQPGPTR